MFYPTDIESGQNCLLNSEDHESKADSFVAEDAGVNMIYFAIGDSTEHKKHRLGSSFKRLDSPIKFDDNGWTKWSKCKHDVKNSIRQRYMKCSYEKDVRKCPKQSAMCKPPSLQIKKLTKPENECRALRDSKGLRRCPHGLRVDHFGIRHYCRNPVDC
ncbi:Apple domain-containing protein [Aphelenchoides bicaudatus]|nr:Apple domain-containing protein [Aphelenchoides bicaudatus]